MIEHRVGQKEIRDSVRFLSLLLIKGVYVRTEARESEGQKASPYR